MVILLLQSLLVLVVAYLVGLPIGGALGRMLTPSARPVVPPAVIQDEEAIPTYHGFELSPAAEPVPEPLPEPLPEPWPKPSHEAIVVPLRPDPPPPPPLIKPKWEERIYFPTQTFGIAVRCCPPELNIVRRPEPSPLAGLAPADQQDILARTRLSEEPERLWKPEDQPDDLTQLGMDADEAEILNRLGIFHTWQVAQWSPQHVLWIARRLKDPSRIINGDWIGRAAQVAA